MKKTYFCKTSVARDGKETLEDSVQSLLSIYSNEVIIETLRTKQYASTRGLKPKKLFFFDDVANRIDHLIGSSTSTPASIDDVIDALSFLASVNSSVSGESRMAHWLSFNDRKPREGQDKFYANVFDSLSDGKIGLCEASTGAGKTTATLAALSDAIKGTGLRGLIAVPSIALVEDYAVEHSKLGPGIHPIRIFLGIGEFVSEIELIAFLDSWTGFDKQAEKVRDWISKGGPSHSNGLKQCYLKHTLRLLSPDIPVDEVLLQPTSVDTDGGMTAYRKQFDKEVNAELREEILLCSHAMLAVDIRVRLMVASNAAVQSGQVSDTLSEKRSEIDQAWKSIKENKSNKQETDSAIVAAKKKEKDAALVAMRAAQSEWDQAVIQLSATHGKLPDYNYAIIDEAHLLEQSFSNSLSSYVAIHQFLLRARELARNGLLTKACLKDLESAYGSLCAAAKKQNADTIHVAFGGEVISPLTALSLAAKDGLKKLSQKRLESLPPEQVHKLKEFKSDIACITQATNAIAGQISYLNLSPRLAYPRLFVGKSSVDAYLRFLWSMLKGAACVSATLYTPRDNELSSWYMQTILAIPENRKKDFEPVIPQWIRETIASIRMPSCELTDGRLKLCPPARRGMVTEDGRESADDVWCMDVAKEIASIHASSVGGCLVLMTSYSAVRKVKQMLMAAEPSLASLIVYAQQGETSASGTANVQAITIKEQQRKFLEISLAGERPIWLALGGAWQGINISGGQPMMDTCGVEIPPHEDNVLTDLIVPRLPFGVNKSITHAHRVNHRKKINWEIIDTLLRLRQGFGRLVRRHGLPKNRRVHLLDARLCSGHLSTLEPAVKKAIGLV